MDFERVKQEVEKAATEKVTQKATERVLTCPEARALAEKLGVDYLTVGRACNEVGVKVRLCELGCF